MDSIEKDIYNNEEGYRKERGEEQCVAARLKSFGPAKATGLKPGLTYLLCLCVCVWPNWTKRPCRELAIHICVRLWPEQTSQTSREVFLYSNTVVMHNLPKSAFSSLSGTGRAIISAALVLRREFSLLHLY